MAETQEGEEKLCCISVKNVVMSLKKAMKCV